MTLVFWGFFFYFSAEVQSVYSRAPANWTNATKGWPTLLRASELGPYQWMQLSDIYRKLVAEGSNPSAKVQSVYSTVPDL